MSKEKFVILQCLGFSEREMMTLAEKLCRLQLKYWVVITNKRIAALTIEELENLLKNLKRCKGEDNDNDEWKPDEEATHRICDLYCCYDCGKTIDIKKDVYLSSRPFLFWKRYRCKECGERFQRSHRAEMFEKWHNILKGKN